MMAPEQPTRRRRRRRRHRASGGAFGIFAPIIYLLGAIQRATRWTALLLIIGVILYLALGPPPRILENMFLWWGHW